MFHLKDGWYFERTAMGDVKIVKKASPMGDAPVVAEIVVPPNEWASVVASVCFDGENAETFGAMQEFHNAGLLRTPVAAFSLPGGTYKKGEEIAPAPIPLRSRFEVLEAIFQALGEGSLAWEPTPEGVFDSDAVKRIGDELLNFIMGPVSVPSDPNQGGLPLNAEDKTDERPQLVSGNAGSPVDEDETVDEPPPPEAAR